MLLFLPFTVHDPTCGIHFNEDNRHLVLAANAVLYVRRDDCAGAWMLAVGGPACSIFTAQHSYTTLRDAINIDSAFWTNFGEPTLHNDLAPLRYAQSIKTN